MPTTATALNASLSQQVAPGQQTAKTAAAKIAAPANPTDADFRQALASATPISANPVQSATAASAALQSAAAQAAGTALTPATTPATTPDAQPDISDPADLAAAGGKRAKKASASKLPATVAAGSAAAPSAVSFATLLPLQQNPAALTVAGIAVAANPAAAAASTTQNVASPTVQLSAVCTAQSSAVSTAQAFAVSTAQASTPAPGAFAPTEIAAPDPNVPTTAPSLNPGFAVPAAAASTIAADTATASATVALRVQSSPAISTITASAVAANIVAPTATDTIPATRPVQVDLKATAPAASLSSALSPPVAADANAPMTENPDLATLAAQTQTTATPNPAIRTSPTQALPNQTVASIAIQAQPDGLPATVAGQSTPKLHGPAKTADTSEPESTAIAAGTFPPVAIAAVLPNTAAPATSAIIAAAHPAASHAAKTADTDASGQTAPSPAPADAATILPGAQVDIAAGTSQLASSPAPAKAADITRQVAAALPAGSLVKSSAGTALHIALNPDTLGSITVKISQHPSGDTAVTISASQPETLAALKHDVSSLNQVLTNAGIPETSRQLDFQILPVTAPQTGTGADTAGQQQGGQPAGLQFTNGQPGQGNSQQSQQSNTAFVGTEFASNVSRTAQVASSATQPRNFNRAQAGVNVIA